jgi:hypothetical protein
MENNFDVRRDLLRELDVFIAQKQKLIDEYESILSNNPDDEEVIKKYNSELGYIENKLHTIDMVLSKINRV